MAWKAARFLVGLDTQYVVDHEIGIVSTTPIGVVFAALDFRPVGPTLSGRVEGPAIWTPGSSRT